MRRKSNGTVSGDGGGGERASCDGVGSFRMAAEGLCGVDGSNLRGYVKVKCEKVGVDGGSRVR